MSIIQKGSLRADGKGYQVRAQNGSAEIYLYEEIDRYWGIGAKQVRDDLKEIGQVTRLDVHLNTEGGSLFEGLAIYNLFKQHSARVVMYVDGMALSVGSLIAMAGDEIVIAGNAWMMIHNPISAEWGTADELRAMAELLDRWTDSLVNTYAARTGLDYEEVADLMTAETWFDAEEAVAKGFADRISESLKIAAHVDPERFLRIPERLRNQQSPPNQGSSSMADKTTDQPQPASYKDLKAAFPNASPEFITIQLDAEATLDQATRNYQAALEARAAEAEKKTEEAEAKAQELEAKIQTKKTGVDPIGDGSAAARAPDDDPEAAFWGRVAEKEKRGIPRARAVRATVREDPELHQAMLDAHNERARAAGYAHERNR